LKELRLFHLTGTRSRSELAPPERLRPALFARYHDLAALRYDFPIVLVDAGGAGSLARTLSDVIDELLREVAPQGMTGERIRRSLLRLEREIRRLMAEGETGPLSSLWARAEAGLATRGGAPVAADLAQARALLRVEGELVDCDASLAARLVSHAWHKAEERRATEMRGRIGALVARLADLLRADHLRSRSGRTASGLAEGIGAAHRDLFDFDVMARLLAKPSGASGLSHTRRARIVRALATLRAQCFFADEAGYDFTFARADLALIAYRTRLPALASLVKAIAVAELEAAGEYAEGVHDEYFARFNEGSVTENDLARFPSYLVRLGHARDAAGRTQLLEALSSGAPLKILVETDDLLGRSSAGDVSLSLDTHLATTAIGLGDVFVVQSVSSHLYRVRGPLAAAMACPGPALVSVFSGAAPGGLVPPYLVAAAAMESRAFPTFAYDPAAADGAARLSLEGNPQPERTWPEHEIVYADAELQRRSERTAFTFADFALIDPRFASHYARVPSSEWNGETTSAGAWLTPRADRHEQLPIVYAVDEDQRLVALAVDEKLLRAALRSSQAWLRLQELARRAPAAQVAAPEAGGGAASPAIAASATTVSPEPATAPEPAAAASEGPYIETPRCTSCNECVLLSSAMFAYDENKQAYLKDAGAGSYRTLVEAAEGCQVAIIHPGRPRDPNEDGLDELLKRAEAFA
jgi:hypothetical protein